MKLKIKALRTGYINHLRQREGDVFSIEDKPRRALFKAEQSAVEGGRAEAIYERIKDKDGKIPAAFSFRWMEPVADRTPEKTTSAPQALKKHHDKTLAEKAGVAVGEPAASTGDADVI